MELWQKIVETYPETGENGFAIFGQEIFLQDDSDGKGAYIAKWEYELPIPAGLKLGK